MIKGGLMNVKETKTTLKSEQALCHEGKARKYISKGL
jgi:hypothetical protein